MDKKDQQSEILTKRETIAKDLLSALMTNHNAIKDENIINFLGLTGEYEFPKHWDMYVAKRTVQITDALLAELENNPK